MKNRNISAHSYFLVQEFIKTDGGLKNLKTILSMGIFLNLLKHVNVVAQERGLALNHEKNTINCFEVPFYISTKHNHFLVYKLSEEFPMYFTLQMNKDMFP